MQLYQVTITGLYIYKRKEPQPIGIIQAETYEEAIDIYLEKCKLGNFKIGRYRIDVKPMYGEEYIQFKNPIIPIIFTNLK